MSVTQQNRQIGITTALDSDVLVLNRVTVREQLGALFDIQVELSSTDGNVNYDKAVGHPATVRLEMGDKGTRYFCGYISRLVQTGNQGGFARYRADIVPWLWFLTRTSDCRIFQRKKAIEIAEAVFNGRRFGAEFFDPVAKGPFPQRRYCVQYRETDFNFVSRLFESEGIYYWFEHKEEEHKLILADGIGASKPADGFESLEFQELAGEAAEGRDVITDWIIEKQVQPVEYTLKDFDFKKPSDSLDAKHEIKRQHGMARFGIYDYPGEYFESGDASRYARLRLEELQARYEVVSAVTTARGLAAGNVFTLEKHPRDDQNRKYLITSLTLTADAGEFASGGSGDEFFSCNFQAVPADTQYRPSRVTPKPIIQGVQTATVVGPSGEEIHTDEHARVKVRFHWDRDDEIGDEDRTCFIRVSHPWAGKNWGAIATPRIGQEVIVEFLEGDPDRPMVTGRVYNGEQVPPYDLPANKTQSGVKSRSSKGGSGANFNEIRMEDKKGSEELYVHAEKDQTNIVENDKVIQVGHDETITIGHDQTETVENNRIVKIGVNHTEEIGSSMNITVGSTLTEMVGVNYAETVGAAMELTVGAALAITVGAAMAETVGGAKVESVGMVKSENVGGNRSLNVGGDKNETIAKNRNVSVAKDQKTTIGGQQKISVTKEYILNAKKVQIVAEEEILLKTGSASITLKKNGDILIDGKKIEVKGSGDVVIKGSQIKEN